MPTCSTGFSLCQGRVKQDVYVEHEARTTTMIGCTVGQGGKGFREHSLKAVLLQRQSLTGML